VEAIPAAAIVGVWVYCLAWLVVIDVLKLLYWGAVERADRAMAAM
jgi:H+-transporting ATPase